MNRRSTLFSFCARPVLSALVAFPMLAGCPKPDSASTSTAASAGDTTGADAASNGPDTGNANADAKAAGSAGDKAAAPDAAAPSGPTSKRLLAWLDPDATSVAYLRRDRTLDGEQLATIFGLPPHLEDLVKAPSDLAWALGVLLDADHPEVVQSWFDDDVLVMRPRVANGLYLVRRLVRPASELKAALSSDGVISEREGFDVYMSRSAVPFSLVFLDEDVVAFIPRREIGTGLSPLTAARDLPASPAEQELTAVLDGSRALSLVALAAGPLTHLDLDHEVARARVTLARRDDGVLDGEVAMQMLAAEQAGHAVEQLKGRTVFAAEERIKEIAAKVAFTADGDVVTGRLQLPRSDADVLVDGRLRGRTP